MLRKSLWTSTCRGKLLTSWTFVFPSENISEVKVTWTYGCLIKKKAWRNCQMKVRLESSIGTRLGTSWVLDEDREEDAYLYIKAHRKLRTFINMHFYKILLWQRRCSLATHIHSYLCVVWQLYVYMCTGIILESLVSSEKAISSLISARLGDKEWFNLPILK